MALITDSDGDMVDVTHASTDQLNQLAAYLRERISIPLWESDDEKRWRIEELDIVKEELEARADEEARK
jgi:hypothetical protein